MKLVLVTFTAILMDLNLLAVICSSLFSKMNKIYQVFIFHSALGFHLQINRWQAQKLRICC
jgi:hypothetical protein